MLKCRLKMDSQIKGILFTIYFISRIELSEITDKFKTKFRLQIKLVLKVNSRFKLFKPFRLKIQN